MQQTASPQSLRYTTHVDTHNDAAMLRLHRAGWPTERIGEQFHVSVDAVSQAVGRASAHQPEGVRAALNGLRWERLRLLNTQ
ncbi:MAG TPA: hypothetical protein VGM78_04920 [Ilumatobacteraceae bacterium]|jgi:hypothetical protein